MPEGVDVLFPKARRDDARVHPFHALPAKIIRVTLGVLEQLPVFGSQDEALGTSLRIDDHRKAIRSRDSQAVRRPPLALSEVADLKTNRTKRVGAHSFKEEARRKVRVEVRRQMIER